MASFKTRDLIRQFEEKCNESALQRKSSFVKEKDKGPYESNFEKNKIKFQTLRRVEEDLAKLKMRILIDRIRPEQEIESLFSDLRAVESNGNEDIDRRKSSLCAELEKVQLKMNDYNHQTQEHEEEIGSEEVIDANQSEAADNSEHRMRVSVNAEEVNAISGVENGSFSNRDLDEDSDDSSVENLEGSGNFEEYYADNENDQDKDENEDEFGQERFTVEPTSKESWDEKVSNDFDDSSASMTTNPATRLKYSS